MKLRQLEYFLAIVEHGGVHRAADALHLAQSSLSQTMRALEKDLGVPLFHRVGRGITLTSAGEGLVGPARSILREADNARRVVTDIAEARSGRLDIAALSELVADPVATWISLFMSDHPGVQCRIDQSEDVSTVNEMVRSGASEVGFVTVRSAGDLEYVKLIDQVFVLLCPPGSEDRWPDPVPLASLRDESFVLGEQGSTARGVVEGALRDHGVEPRIVVEAHQREAVLPLVLSGCAMGIAPLRTGVSLWQRGGVVREVEPGLSTPIYLVKRPGALTAAGETFVAAARASLEAWVAAVGAPGEGVPLVERAFAGMTLWDRRVRGTGR